MCNIIHIISIFAPKNKKNINELLNLKFNNDYDELDYEYRIHEFVNYILIDSLADYYKDNYLDKATKKLIRKRNYTRKRIC